MKKIFILTALCLASLLQGMAQEKGDMYISGSFSVSGGSDRTSVSAGGVTTKTSEPSSVNFNIGPQFGFFIIDNLELNIGVGYSLNKAVRGKDGDRYLWNNTGLFTITPGINYHLKICDKLYYTPGFNFSIGAGSTTKQLDSKTKESNGTFGFGMSLAVLSIEARPCEHIGICFSAGELGYAMTSESDEETILDTKTKTTNTTHRVGFGINTGATIGFKYYF